MFWFKWRGLDLTTLPPKRSNRIQQEIKAATYLNKIVRLSLIYTSQTKNASYMNSISRCICNVNLSDLSVMLSKMNLRTYRSTYLKRNMDFMAINHHLHALSVPEKKYVTSNKLLDSVLPNCFVFACETKENLNLHQKSLEASFHVPIQLRKSP